MSAPLNSSSSTQIKYVYVVWINNTTWIFFVINELMIVIYNLLSIYWFFFLEKNHFNKKLWSSRYCWNTKILFYFGKKWRSLVQFRTTKKKLTLKKNCELLFKSTQNEIKFT